MTGSSKHPASAPLAVSLVFLFTLSAMAWMPAANADSFEESGQTRAASPPPFYMNHTTLNSYLLSIEENNSGIVKLHEVGASWEARLIYGVQITDNPGVDEGEKEVLVVGNMHGDELVSGEVVLGLLDKLVSEYGSNDTITQLVDNRDIWLIPVLNPDGREMTIGGVPWRKNMRPNSDGSYGVDLNRNFDNHWGETGASTSPPDENYIGPYAFSEPESMALRDLCDDHNFSIAISYHSYGQYVWYPWGWGTTPPPDQMLLDKLAEETAQLNGCTPGQASDPGAGGYSASGDACDWMYANRDSLSFTIEIGYEDAPPDPTARIQQHLPGAFYLLEKSEDPVSVIERNWSVLAYMSGSDQSLNDALLDDLNEMEAIGPSEGLSITALFDGNGYNDSWLYDIEKDPVGLNSQLVTTGMRPGEVIPASGECYMGQSATLKAFIEWGLANRPGKRTMLVFGGHGNGIFKGVCGDGGDYLSLVELKEAFEGAMSEFPGKRIDVVGFDVCWFGTAEVALEMSPFADYVVFSQDEEPMGGWDYQALLHRLQQNTALSPETVALDAVETFWAASSPYSYTTISTVNLSKYASQFQPKLDQLAEAFTVDYPSRQSQFWNAYNNTETYRSQSPIGTDPDFGHFLSNLELEAPLPPELRQLIDQTQTAYNASIMREYHSTSHQSTGMCIFIPPYNYIDEYDQTSMGLRPWAVFARQFPEPHPVPEMEHTPLQGILESTGPFNITVNVSNAENMTSLKLLYDNGTGAQGLDMQEDNSTGDWTAQIPVQAAGTLVKYRLEAENDQNVTVTDPPTHYGGDDWHSFVAGTPGDLWLINASWEWRTDDIRINWTAVWTGSRAIALDMRVESADTTIFGEQRVTANPNATLQAWENIDHFNGTKHVTITLDPYGLIFETDEGNNTMTLNITKPTSSPGNDTNGTDPGGNQTDPGDPTDPGNGTDPADPGDPTDPGGDGGDGTNSTTGQPGGDIEKYLPFAIIMGGLTGALLGIMGPSGNKRKRRKAGGLQGSGDL